MKPVSYTHSLALHAIVTCLHFTVSIGRPANDVSTPTKIPKNGNGNFKGQFWAGADIGTVPRAEAIPGRKFYDFDGTTQKDPVKTLADAGVNALRVVTDRSQCLGPTNFINNGSERGDELDYKLDFGCIDTQAKIALRGVDQGMRVVHTINQGFTIPKAFESYTYAQMISEVQKEAKRQLQPFLDAEILPDIILFENEGTDGFLFIEESTGRMRGVKANDESDSTLDRELCGALPTGNMASYPQYSGYLKAEIIACNEAILAAGYSNATVRYGLHSHGQYVQWKEETVHSPKQLSQTDLKDSSGKTCTGEPAIPADILAQNVSTMLTIAGFSAYPDPMTPTDINSADAQKATLNRLTETLTQIQGYAEAYGKYDSGPFAGQHKLQSFGVEYATSFSADEILQQQTHTELMWKTVKGFENFLGMMWWEPWYCYNHWEGGKATLCKTGTWEENSETPTDTLKTWGKAAVSPWKD